MYTAIILVLLIMSILVILNIFGHVYLFGKFYDIHDDNELLKEYKNLYYLMIILMPFNYLFSKRYRYLLKEYKLQYQKYKDKINE